MANEILLYHKGSFRLLDQLDCNMRKLTAGRSIALLIQSLEGFTIALAIHSLEGFTIALAIHSLDLFASLIARATD